MNSEELDRKEEIYFCPCCFGSADNSSWGECVDDYCYNCGSGSTLKIPRWAVESLRKQASWVGKRYYPHEEDVDSQKELRLLRSLMPDNPEDEVTPTEGGYWSVERRTSPTRTTSVLLLASSREDAMKKAKVMLPYVSGDSE